MIRTPREYEIALRSLQEQQEYADAVRREMIEEGATEDEIEAGMAPINLFLVQSRHDIVVYEKLSSGDSLPLEAARNAGPAALGRLLIFLRIFRKVTQRQLARALDVDESQVSRDERNEYHAVTADRAQKIVDALGGIPTFADASLNQDMAQPRPRMPREALDSYRERKPQSLGKDGLNESDGCAA